MRLTHRARRLARPATLAVLLTAALLSSSAAKLQCSSEAGSPQDNPAVTHAAAPRQSYRHLEVRVRVNWLYNRFTGNRNIEIATTKPGSTTPTEVHLVANRDDHLDQWFAIAPGQRVSVTADQDNTGYLQASIVSSDDMTWYLDETHRNDSGSVHAEWTRPVQGLG